MKKKLKEKFEESGFIVHPFETGNSMYQASYKSHNKTNKSFKNLRSAKAYLKSKGIKKALYDSPSGSKTLKLERKITLKRKLKAKGEIG